MRIAPLRALLDRPVPPRRGATIGVGRLAVLLFGVEIVTGSLLALYYRPAPEAAFASVEFVTNSVSFGWLVRSVHRTAGHALVAVAGLYLARAYFRRSFLASRGAAVWTVAVALSLVALAFLLTGESLPWDQTAYWRIVLTANGIAETPVAGPALATLLRGGAEVSGLTLVRLYAIHALFLPWVALGGLLAARALLRRGGKT